MASTAMQRESQIPEPQTPPPPPTACCRNPAFFPAAAATKPPLGSSDRSSRRVLNCRPMSPRLRQFHPGTSEPPTCLSGLNIYEQCCGTSQLSLISVSDRKVATGAHGRAQAVSLAEARRASGLLNQCGFGFALEPGSGLDWDPTEEKRTARRSGSTEPRRQLSSFRTPCPQAAKNTRHPIGLRRGRLPLGERPLKQDGASALSDR